MNNVTKITFNPFDKELVSQLNSLNEFAVASATPEIYENGTAEHCTELYSTSRTDNNNEVTTHRPVTR